MTRKVIRRTFELAVFSALLLIGVRSFVSLGWIVPLVVQGNSMAPHYVEETITASRLQIPKRWDPILFRDPHGSGQLWIKRLVGLHNEVIQISQGDLWINGNRHVKSFDNQKRLRIQRTESLSQSAWRADEPWHCSNGSWSCSTIKNVDSRLEPIKPITDDLACNDHLTRLANKVNDLMLSFQISESFDGKLMVIMPDFQVEIYPGYLVVRSVSNDLLFEKAIESKETHLTLSSFDKSILIALDDHVVFHQPITSTLAFSSSEALPCLIARGNKVEIRELKLWRDVYYTGAFDNAAPPTKPVKVAKDGYFVLGDNPAVSLDSRNWDAPASVPKSACLGVVAPASD